MRVRRFLWSAVLLVTGCSSPAWSDTPGQSPFESRLVNLEGAGVGAKGVLNATADLRILNGAENRTYAGLSVRYGATPTLEVGLRGATASTGAFLTATDAMIRHGGHDTEIFAKVGLGVRDGVRLAAFGGVSFAGTPAQSDRFLTLGGVGEVRVDSNLVLTVNPRAVFVDRNTIAGIGVGASCRVSERVRLVGDWTTVVAGDNTRATDDGRRIRRDVWGAALRVTAQGDHGPCDIDIGWGNGTGSTTGFGLTPGLGRSTGLYLALHARR